MSILGEKVKWMFGMSEEREGAMDGALPAQPVYQTFLHWQVACEHAREFDRLDHRTGSTRLQKSRLLRMGSFWVQNPIDRKGHPGEGGHGIGLWAVPSCSMF